MSQTQEYSVWLVPDEDTEEYGILSDIISEYSQKYPDAPDFKPHVTVVGGIEENGMVKDRTQEVASYHNELNLSFIDASCSTTNRQCVFLLVNPSVELLKLHERANNLLDRGVSMYTPHLSLTYSDMSFENRIREVQSIELNSLPDTVRMSTVELFDTTGAVSNWNRTGEYPLE